MRAAQNMMRTCGVKSAIFNLIPTSKAIVQFMVFIWDGCSFYYADILSKSGIFFECIWLHRKSRQILFLFRKRPILHHACATCSKLPSYISTMAQLHLKDLFQITRAHRVLSFYTSKHHNSEVSSFLNISMRWAMRDISWFMPDITKLVSAVHILCTNPRFPVVIR